MYLNSGAFIDIFSNLFALAAQMILSSCWDSTWSRSDMSKNTMTFLEKLVLKMKS